MKWWFRTAHNSAQISIAGNVKGNGKHVCELLWIVPCNKVTAVGLSSSSLAFPGKKPSLLDDLHCYISLHTASSVESERRICARLFVLLETEWSWCWWGLSSFCIVCCGCGSKGKCNLCCILLVCHTHLLSWLTISS